MFNFECETSARERGRQRKVKTTRHQANQSLELQLPPYPETFASGPATFLPSFSPVCSSTISSQLIAFSVFPVFAETAKSTPSELASQDDGKYVSWESKGGKKGEDATRCGKEIWGKGKTGVALVLDQAGRSGKWTRLTRS